MSNKIKTSLKPSVDKTSSGSSRKNEHVTNDFEQIELRIQNERILLVVDSLIDKVKVAVCLPIFLANDSFLMNKFLSPDDVDYIKNSCRKYAMPICTKSRSFERNTYSKLINNISLLRSSTKGIKTSSAYNAKINKFVDLHIKQALEILYKNHSLKQEVQKEYKFYVDSACVHFIEILQRIKGIVANKLKMSAVTEIDKEKALNKAWRENKNLEKDLSEINNEIARQRQAFIDEAYLKNETIQKLQMNIRSFEFKFKEDARNIVSMKEISMIEDREVSKQKQADLSYDVKTIQQQYETLLAQHVTKEKKLRAKRIKVEQQLVSWLAKYDSDMSDRQNEFDELTAGFNEEHQELIALQIKFDEQLPIHKQLMIEKEEEEHKQWCEAVIKFIRNRSARAIQRWWRPIYKVIYERKAARKAAGKARAAAKK